MPVQFIYKASFGLLRIVSMEFQLFMAISFQIFMIFFLGPVVAGRKVLESENMKDYKYHNILEFIIKLVPFSVAFLLSVSAVSLLYGYRLHIFHSEGSWIFSPFFWLVIIFIFEAFSVYFILGAYSRKQLFLIILGQGLFLLLLFILAFEYEIYAPGYDPPPFL